MKNQSRSRNQSHTHRNYKDVYDGYKLVELYDNDTLLVSFTWQPESVGGLDVPVSMTYAGNTYSYVTDGNKNVTALLDAAGFRVAGYTYGPFGQVLSMDGALAEVNPFRFSSEFHDDETGLVYYNYRYYSPSLGRWTKRDPIGEEGGVNEYGTNQNNLVNYFDLLGLNYLLLFHENFDPMFSKWANYTAKRITERLPTMYGNTVPFNSKEDTIVIIPVIDYSTFVEAAEKYSCVSFLATFGHGHKGNLWFNQGSWDLSKDTEYNEENNLETSYAFGMPGSTVGSKSHRKPVEELLIFDFTPEPIIELYHCKTLRRFQLESQPERSLGEYMRELLPAAKIFGFDGGINNSNGKPVPKGFGMTNLNPPSRKPQAGTKPR